MIRLILGRKKSNEKNTWLMNKFIFISFWPINIDAVFYNLFVNIFALVNTKEVCHFNDKHPKKNIWMQRNSLFKTANSPVKNIRVEKRDNKNLAKMR